MKEKIKPGDVVEVLRPSEILKTLDSGATINHLPFMPEMLEHCGKKFKVRSRVEKTCVSSNAIKEFLKDDIVFLDNLRCSGKFHDGCQRGCMIFWNEAWLKKSDSKSVNMEIDLKEADELKGKLKIKENDKQYFCQSTQLNQSTKKISMVGRALKLGKEVLSGTTKVHKAVKSILFPIWRKLHYKLIFGNLNQTPSHELNLQPGELVEIKSFEEIRETLNKTGSNKGLEFHHDMKEYCGKRFTVRNRLEKMISETTGEMLNVKNTVILNDITCCFEYRFLGCTRERFQFWREIWLKRVQSEKSEEKISQEK